MKHREAVASALVEILLRGQPDFIRKRGLPMETAYDMADATIACLRERWTSDEAVDRARVESALAPNGDDPVKVALKAAMRDEE